MIWFVSAQKMSPKFYCVIMSLMIIVALKTISYLRLSYFHIYCLISLKVQYSAHIANVLVNVLKTDVGNATAFIPYVI